MLPRTYNLSRQTVLAITKRTADLVSKLSSPYLDGFDLVTATNMTAARCVMKAIAVRVVFICRDSWSGHERESIISEFAANHPEVIILSLCAKCGQATGTINWRDFSRSPKKPPSAEGKPIATAHVAC